MFHAVDLFCVIGNIVSGIDPQPVIILKHCHHQTILVSVVRKMVDIIPVHKQAKRDNKIILVLSVKFADRAV